METKQTIDQFDAELEKLQRRLLEAERAESTARADHKIFNDEAYALRKLQRDVQVRAAAGDDVDATDFDTQAAEAFEVERTAFQHHSVTEEACQLLRKRVRELQDKRDDYVQRHVPGAYLHQYEQINGDLRDLLSRAIVAYARVNSLAPGTIEPERLLRIMNRGKPPLDLVGASKQLVMELGA